MPETTPYYGLQAPLGSEQISAGDDLMRATNSTIDTALHDHDTALAAIWTDNLQRGTVTVSVSASNTGTATVTFPTAFAATPIAWCQVKLSSTGDADAFWYASIGDVTPTTMEVYCTNRNESASRDVTVRWFAAGALA